MELLKFNDAPKSARRGKNPAGFIGAGIMVAVMGLSSTLAGTITIGTGTVEFGQGLVQAAACDSTIELVPSSQFNDPDDGGTAITTETFTVGSLNLRKVGLSAGAAGAGTGCGGAVLEIRAYAGSTLRQFKYESETAKVLTVFIPTGLNNTTVLNDVFKLNTFNFSGSPAVLGESNVFTPTYSRTGSTVAATDGDAGVNLLITGLSIPSDVTRFTIESRAPREMED